MLQNGPLEGSGGQTSPKFVNFEVPSLELVACLIIGVKSLVSGVLASPESGFKQQQHLLMKWLFRVTGSA
eukprot:4293159-Alexandrium_andersonii.AAC.1